MNIEIRIEVIKKMTRIAQEVVKYHFADFTCYDIPTIVKYWDDFKIGFWFVRECGTHLLLVQKDTDVEDVMNTLSAYAKYNDRVYMFFNDKDNLFEFDINTMRNWG